MISPPHKHDVLKNKKPPKGSQNTSNGTVSRGESSIENPIDLNTNILAKTAHFL